MKTIDKFIPFALIIAAGFSLADSAQALTLFADNFNRDDNTSLNALDTGKAGALGALDWVEQNSGGGAAITTNAVRIGETGGGGGWAISYVDHNFVDSSISSSGTFTVSLDLVAPITSRGSVRFTGFGVGHSQAELDAWSTNQPTSFDSDFFFGYDTAGTNEVKTFVNGTEDYQQGINLDTTGGTLSVAFTNVNDL